MAASISARGRIFRRGATAAASSWSAVDQWMGGAADPTSTVASASVTPMFAALAVIGMVPLFFYLRALRDREE